MATYILTWNPKRWHWDEKKYAKEVQQTAVGKLFSSQWSTGNTKSMVPGDRLFLMRQGSDRGIIGSGYATSASFYDGHWDDSRDDDALYVKYSSDTLLKTEDRLPVEVLLDAGLGVAWNSLIASGISVPEKSVEKLEQIWHDHLADLGRSSHGQTDLEESTNADDEIDRVLRQIIQRRGQPRFRAQLLEAYGSRCAITGCDAEAALEAAHIVRYSGPSSNRLSNGILLRSDLHTLFDLGLICIHPKKLTVIVSDCLIGTHYEEFHGQKVRLPTAKSRRPSVAALTQCWNEFAGCK